MDKKYFWLCVALKDGAHSVFGFATEAEARAEGIRRKAAGGRVSISPGAMTPGQMVRALGDSGIIPEIYRY